MARTRNPTPAKVLKQGVKCIRVQLDDRTMITLKNAQILTS
jgi:hypothetical protein